MSRPLIYLDLDRTLYRTTQAGVALWEKIIELYPQIAKQDGHDRQREFYLYASDNTYAYDFAAHARSLGLDVDTVYRQVQVSELADGRFEHDGTRELVDWLRGVADVRILTYGVDDFQRFKATLCPSLSGIPVETTLQEKGDYLQESGPVWLVDDKPLHGKLPDNVQFIHILHDTDGADARSLNDVMVALKSKI